MDLVVDANILFAALIKDGATVEILLDKDSRFFIPELLLEEFAEHRKEILAKTKRGETEFDELLGYFHSILVIVPKEEFAHLIGDAASFSPDADDVQYLALALLLGIPVWSNDKRLKRQSKVEILSTEDIIVRGGYQKGV
jgi:predicted nucleic acid-binding protein